MISITGIVVKKTMNLYYDKTFILLYGIIFQTLFIGIFAFFYKIGIIFFIVNSSQILVATVFVKNDLKQYINSLFENFSPKTKIIFLILVLLTALKSAQPPSIFDNETYYIQTIKWINEFGFVKGIANVHPFLAQYSFWHVFQCGFNFSFLGDIFNDVNGLLLVIGIYYFLHNYNLKSNFLIIINGLFLVIYFQFIDAPSVDLPILVFLIIIFYEFIHNPLNTQKRKSLLLFLIFLVFIKLTVAPLLLLLLFIIIGDRKIIVFGMNICLLFGFTWIAKNIIITGYPLFPLKLFDFNFDWKLPIESMNYMYKNINNLGYAENASVNSSYNLLEKLNFWIHLKGINGFFNISVLILIIWTPFTKIFKSSQNYKILYFVLLMHFVFLLLNSPQYRFFLPTFICFGTIIINDILKRINFVNTTILLILTFLLLSLSLFIDLKNFSKKSTFNYVHIGLPSSNSKYKNIKLEEKNIGNLTYFDPQLPNLYETSNGKLPCVNKKLFEFYGFFPQMRTSDIRNGFYSKKISQNE